MRRVCSLVRRKLTNGEALRSVRAILGLLLGAVAWVSATPAAAYQLPFEIVNSSGKSDSDVYIMVRGDTTANPPAQLIPNGSPLTINQGVPLTGVKNFTVTEMSACRLVFSYYKPVTPNSTDEDPNVSDIRFDKLELSYFADTSKVSVANLTAADFLGIPMRLEIFDANGTLLGSLSYYKSANRMRSMLQSLVNNPAKWNAVQKMTTGTPPEVARIISPAKTTTANVYPADMAKYVASVAGKSVTIKGIFNGSASSPPGLYNMTGTFAADGTITLQGTAPGGLHGADQPLVIAGNSLADAIYSCNGPYTVGGSPALVKDNDAYAAVYRDLVAGFNLGYVDSVYPNSTDSSTWWSQVPFANARKGRSSALGEPFYNGYAQTVQSQSDAYGFPFTDIQKKVFLDLRRAAKFRITLLPDDTLDAPDGVTISKMTNTSFTATWGAVPNADSYEINYSPPLGGLSSPIIVKPTNPADKTVSVNLTGLSPGTPYSCTLRAVNSKAADAEHMYSEKRNFTATTNGAPPKIIGTARWQMNLDFAVPVAPGDVIIFNGKTYPINTSDPLVGRVQILGAGENPQGIQALVGQNTYVLIWQDSAGKVKYRAVMYVNVTSEIFQSYNKIDTNPAKTFLNNNLKLPTFTASSDPGYNPWVLFLNIDPGQRF